MPNDQDLIEEFTQKHGEKYRSLIINALAWLDENEPKWDLDKPINRHEYLTGLFRRAITE